MRSKDTEIAAGKLPRRIWRRWVKMKLARNWKYQSAGQFEETVATLTVELDTTPNDPRRSTRSWLSSFSSQTAYRPMTTVWRYHDTSICTSRRDGPEQWFSRSHWDRIFWNSVFPRILSLKTKIFFPKIEKIIKFFFAGLRPAPLPYGVVPFPPTKVGAKCLAAVVLNNSDHALCPWAAITCNVVTHARITPSRKVNDRLNVFDGRR